MQTFIFGRNKGRCMRKEHLGNFLQGSIRLAEPEREEGNCCGHTWPLLFHKSFAPRPHTVEILKYQSGGGRECPLGDKAQLSRGIFAVLRAGGRRRSLLPPL